MIKSDIMQIDFTNDISVIENEFKRRGINPVRWAIVEVSDNKLSISISYEC